MQKLEDGRFQFIGASEASPFLVLNVEILSVCTVCMSAHVINRHGTARYFGFATRDPYPFNFADELGVSNFAELAPGPHNALSIPLVIIIMSYSLVEGNHEACDDHVARHLKGHSPKHQHFLLSYRVIG